MRSATTTLRTSAGVVLVALLLATPAPAADCAAREGDDAVVCELNRARADRGLQRLEGDRRLRRAAEAHATDMAERTYFAHVTPEGETLSDRLRATGYIDDRHRWHVGETLAWGRGRRSTPASIVAAWLRSPLHRRIVLGRYREVGIGVADGDPFGGSGLTYAADFGRVGR
jgi:uncharacterized protein YkwD